MVTYPRTISGNEHPPSRAGSKPLPTRKVLEAILWILKSGAQWHMLQKPFPNYITVHRRFQTCYRNDVLRQVMTDLSNTLCNDGVFDESEYFIDATLTYT